MHAAARCCIAQRPRAPSRPLAPPAFAYSSVFGPGPPKSDHSCSAGQTIVAQLGAIGQELLYPLRAFRACTRQAPARVQAAQAKGRRHAGHLNRAMCSERRETSDPVPRTDLCSTAKHWKWWHGFDGTTNDWPRSIDARHQRYGHTSMCVPAGAVNSALSSSLLITVSSCATMA